MVVLKIHNTRGIAIDKLALVTSIVKDVRT